MQSIEIDVVTGSRPQVVDLTSRCGQFVTECGGGDGLLSIFVPHATAGVAVLETGAGSDEDLLRALLEVLPVAGPGGEGWRHRHGAAGHGRDHVLPAFISPSMVVPVVAGSLTLGTWQSICLVDTNVDNPRRAVRFSLLRASG